MPWIPVTERLPDSDLTVMIACDLAYHSEPVWLGYHDGETWRDVDGGDPAFVTHWMPMPEPPMDAAGVTASDRGQQ